MPVPGVVRGIVRRHWRGQGPSTRWSLRAQQLGPRGRPQEKTSHSARSKEKTCHIARSKAKTWQAYENDKMIKDASPDVARHKKRRAPLQGPAEKRRAPLQGPKKRRATRSRPERKDGQHPTEVKSIRIRQLLKNSVCPCETSLETFLEGAHPLGSEIRRERIRWAQK